MATTTEAAVPSQKTSAIGRPRYAVESAWGFTGALLLTVLGSVLLVDELHDQEDLQRQALVIASELEQDAAELRTAQDALRTSEQAVQLRTEIDDEIADLHTTSTQLQNMSGAAVMSGFERDLLAVEGALRTQLASAEAGDVEAAQSIAEQRTEPALDAFDAQVEATNDHFASAAARSSWVSEIGVWMALLVAGLAIGGLSWRYERARRAAQEALEERLQERVAEVAAITERHRQLEDMKYSFVSAVSHELRTPLTAIYGSLEMLEDGDVGEATAKQLVSVAARGTRRLSRLVEDVIDLERLESGHFGFHPAPHDLYELLLETVESLAPLTEHAGIELVLQETHADVMCDGDRLLQALVNLVGNAIKFTPPGGSIYLEAVCGHEEVEVTVRDEGRGIPADHLDAVFDRFHQVDAQGDPAKGGAGLGLAITRRIVETQGGRIWVESEPGTGTAFRFTVPLARPEPPDAEPLPEPGKRR